MCIRDSLRGVDLVIRTVIQSNLDIDNGIARKHAGLHGTLDALVDGADELFGDGTTNNCVDELVALSLIHI